MLRQGRPFGGNSCHSAEAGLAAAQVTLNSAKAHYGVEGDAQKRVLEKMREMLGSQASQGQALAGQALPNAHQICCTLTSLCSRQRNDELP